ncbi:phosphatidylinositol--trisphosphate 3-phosphatase and dual-specificity protein phosphatase pten [Stylonychia lemnae]|uniref:Phosphatidylinositol 3,4,5-trisphosphate 3-phosphatase and dual-specificity protein phosphatase PTEN n=1 Tax=Stylonychia lemnae TaxID=5949 RepID=A0A078B6J1_STYLE|nr:phosphatidylinositol--trisphosphate 3-phosphatase and dual-specificity protein phosphatase pten [Stylonychia lemnae]|eukprot:CDW89841.1 phosphatidylinositol--trisphosphate 3-phosphatase and dual-specificity protein phosphatase pten [Stylonychia lemnae]
MFNNNTASGGANRSQNTKETTPIYTPQNYQLERGSHSNSILKNPLTTEGNSPDFRDHIAMSTGNFYQTNNTNNNIRNNIPESKTATTDMYYNPQNDEDSDDSSFTYSSEEEDKLDRKVDEVNKLMGISYKKKSLNVIKRMVSRKKRRYVQDDVTPRVIAMGYPGERLEQFYRNSMKDVQEFFKKKHSGYYKIYNLCQERSYNDKSFEKVSQRFRFEDHNPPPFDMILKFCQDIEEFMKEDERNVAAIHCKAGKGRTGVMICCYLIYSREFKAAHDALVFYGKIRTSNGKGVTIPSQIRYVYYFENFLQLRRQLYPQKNLIQMPRQVLKIYKIRMITTPQFQNGGIEPTFKVKYKDTVIYDYKQEGKSKFISSLSYYDFRISKANLLVYDDVKVEFFNKNKLSLKKIFHFWFHTAFIDNSGVLSMDKPMIEKASKDKKCSVFDRNFRIEVYMSKIKNYQMEEVYFDKDVVLELPVEKFTDEQQKLLKMAEDKPKLQRKLSL